MSTALGLEGWAAVHEGFFEPTMDLCDGIVAAYFVDIAFAMWC